MTINLSDIKTIHQLIDLLHEHHMATYQVAVLAKPTEVVLVQK